MNITKLKYAFAAFAAVVMPVIGVAAWVPTADSTTCPQMSDRARSSAKPYGDIAVMRALLHTASFGLDAFCRTPST